MTLEELQQYASDFREGILEGQSSKDMCWAICAPLQSLLTVMNVPCRLLELSFPDTNHFVIELPDGNIVDPTADQFDTDLPPVYAGPMPDIYLDWTEPEIPPD